MSRLNNYQLLVTNYFSRRSSRQLLLIALGFAGGTLIHTVAGTRPVWFVDAVLAALLALIVLGWKSTRARLALFFCFGIAAGIWRFDASLPDRIFRHIAASNGRTAAVEGEVVREPDVRPGSVTAVLAARSVDGAPAVGRVQVVFPPRTAVGYGDQLRLRCDLEPATFPGFLPQKIFSVCAFPESVRPLGTGGRPFMRDLLAAKAGFVAALERFLPAPEAALGSGLLLGTRDQPAEDAAAFRSAGISHIVAVSGYNVAIILTNLLLFFGVIGIPRRLAKLTVVAVLGAFIVITGGSASIIRAGIMGLLPEAGRTLGRPLAGWHTVILAAVVMLAINPFLFHDVGFLLSFAATVGLFWLGPLLGEVIPWGRKSSWHVVIVVRGLFLQTFAAILATIPVVLAAFGTLSLVAPLTNLFVLFVVPAAMLAVFVAGLAGLVTPAIAPIFAFPALAFLRYIRLVARWFGMTPGSSVVIGRLSWVAATLLALGLVCLFLRLRKNVDRVK